MKFDNGCGGVQVANLGYCCMLLRAPCANFTLTKTLYVENRDGFSFLFFVVFKICFFFSSEFFVQIFSQSINFHNW